MMKYQLMNIPKYDYKYELFSIISDKTRNALVIGRKVVVKEIKAGTRKIKMYTLYCHRCGSIFYRSERELNVGKGCICNNHKMVIKGYNDLATMRPDLAKHLKDKNLAYRIRPNSTKKVTFKCSECGNEFKAALNSYFNRTFSCSKCSDGISYPNKFMYSLFDQIGIDYRPEFSPEWAGDKRYDLYFELDGKKYVIEADGGWHFKDNNLSKQTAEESAAIDQLKEDWLRAHDIEIIRIDCRNSTRDFIKENTLSSKLGELFDLSNIDWNQCALFASKSILVEVCKYYDQHNRPSRDEMSKQFKVCVNTITAYLQTGRDLGICSYIDRNCIAEQHYTDTINLFNKKPSISLKELSDVIGVNRNMISSYLRRGTDEGLCNYKTKEELKTEKINTIKGLLEKDSTLVPSHIISITGYPSTTVRRIYKELMEDGQ